MMMMEAGETGGMTKTGLGFKAVVGAPHALSCVVVSGMCVRKRTCMSDMGHAHCFALIRVLLLVACLLLLCG